ncbi:hypothetical protein EDB84DRAFT_1532410 [Lactarius hengduanensis]|nr:hypothetical protein EDB84DRAFT_1532410 [Lactarius hengduanensis]
MASSILGPIRNVYTALHQDTDSAPTRFSASTSDRDNALYAPSSYPVCNVAGHIHDNVVHDNAALPPAPLASPYAHSSSIPAPPHIVESLTEVPSLDGFLPVRRTTMAGRHIPVISPDPTTAGAIRDVVSSALTDGGIPKPGLRKGKDVGPPTVNRAIHANTVTALDLPPQSLSLPSEADSDIAAVAGPSQRAERMGDHSSHCRCHNIGTIR